MPASTHIVPFSDKDFEDRPSYEALEDGDHLATLLSVEDVEAATGNYGWKFVFDVKGLQLSSTLWLKGGGGWKVREVFNALGQPINPGDSNSALNPNNLIGRRCVVTVKREPASNGATYDDGTVKMFTNIKRHTPYMAAPVTNFEDLSYGGTN